MYCHFFCNILWLTKLNMITILFRCYLQRLLKFAFNKSITRLDLLCGFKERYLYCILSL